MTLKELLTIGTSGVYDEDWDIPGQYLDEKGELLPRERRPPGDTLAEFIAVEIAETYDPGRTDREQVEAAARVIQSAKEQLDDVQVALEDWGRMIRRYTAEELEEMPTLAQGQADDLKVEETIHGTKYRVWLCRCGVEDGMPYDNAITIERYQYGRWIEVDMYPG